MYRLVRPLLFKLDPERAHDLAIRAASLSQWLPGIGAVTTTPGLEQDVFGIHFANPVGIAAGLDKNARCIPYWLRIGCGFVEIGSVSAEPAPGNPKPRAFRLPHDRALINRMGLNNDGVEEVMARLPKAKRRSAPIGVNVVKTHRDGLMGRPGVEDFSRCYAAAAQDADYVVLNVSCPNTDDGKTFEEPEALRQLLSAIDQTGPRQQPLLIKLSPPAPRAFDEGRYRELLAVASDFSVDGLVATNTASDRHGLATDPATVDAIGRGGLSGRPIADRSDYLIRFLFGATSGQIPIIGVGGVDSADAALSKIRSGASLVQLYTGLVYEGPALVRRIVQGLARYLERERKKLVDIIGVDA